MPTELSKLREALLKQNSCDAHFALHRSRSPEEAALWHETIKHCSDGAAHEHKRWLALNDLFYLGVYLLHRTHWIGESPKQKDLTPEHQTKIAKWYFERCTEVQDDPNGNLDVWAREHGKSEILTFALLIQDILKDPNETIGIFSHNRPMAKQFLRLIKTEFETNDELKVLFPEMLYRDPQRESTKWSVDDGITVRRTANMKESTIEAWGLVDGQPTSKRFSKLIYDDVVARDQTSEGMIAKTTEELENSFALTASDPPICRFIGTPQEVGDTICDLMTNGKFKVRRHSAADKDGNPHFFSVEKLAFFKNTMSPKVFALQLLVDPDKAQDAHNIGFESSWFLTYKNPRPWRTMNRYILVDPAGRSKESNSYFAAWVIGLCYDKKIYVLDGAVDQLNLAQRGDLIFKWVRQYEIFQTNKVVYEKYAMQADIEYISERMDRENCRFSIVPVGGVLKSKDQRIERLIPRFRSGDILFPESLIYKNLEGENIDVIKRFREIEYAKFPFNMKYRDQLDALSRIEDDAEVHYIWPRSYGSSAEGGEHWNIDAQVGGSWLSG